MTARNEFVAYAQARLASLGFDPGPVDGLDGLRTRRAFDAALPAKAASATLHTLKNPEAFFTGVKAVTGSLTQSQVDGFNAITKALSSWPVTWVSYALATAYHETAATMQPIKEMGGDAYFKRRYDIAGENPALAKRLGNVNGGDGARYAGRGLVQITGRSNYERFGIADNPDKALEPSTAAHIMKEGMEKGLFTGKKLSDYLPGDYVGARKIINGSDRAQKIASYAERFEAALAAGGW